MGGWHAVSDLAEIQGASNRVKKLFWHVLSGFDVIQSFCDVLYDARQFQNLVAVRPLARLHLKALLKHVLQLLRVFGRDLLVLARDHLTPQVLHALPGKGRPARAHFVQNAAQAPNVALVVVGHVFPDFGTGVVGRARHC